MSSNTRLSTMFNMSARRSQFRRPIKRSHGGRQAKDHQAWNAGRGKRMRVCFLTLLSGGGGLVEGGCANDVVVVPSTLMTGGGTMPGDELASSDGTETATSVDSSDDEDLWDNGVKCSSDSQCKSGICNESIFGDVCSECQNSSDCVAAGTGINCSPILGASGFVYECTHGAVGEECTADADCAGELYCSEMVGMWRCSECRDDEDCRDKPETICTDTGSTSGVWLACSPTGTKLDGYQCDIEGNGEAACMNHCVQMPNYEWGICSECRPDEDDCPVGEICEAPTPAPLTPALCVD